MYSYTFQQYYNVNVQCTTIDRNFMLHMYNLTPLKRLYYVLYVSLGSDLHTIDTRQVALQGSYDN